MKNQHKYWGSNLLLVIVPLLFYKQEFLDLASVVSLSCTICNSIEHLASACGR
jgi:hypothetical protein